MNPWNKRLSEVSADDIRGLIDNNRREDRYLDYKRECGVLADTKNMDDKARARFIDDITAFANASGGVMIVGVEERKKDDVFEAMVLCGMDAAILETEYELRLRNIVEAHTEPTLPAGLLEVRPLEVDGKRVLLIQVKQSWLSPHRNRMSGRFMMRDGPKNRELDTLGLRAAFLRGNDEAALLRNFREERIAALFRSGRYNKGVPRYLLHVIPAGSLAGVVSVDPEAADKVFQALPKPQSSNEWKWSRVADPPIYTLEGLVIEWDSEKSLNRGSTPMHAAFLRGGEMELLRDIGEFVDEHAYAGWLEENIAWDVGTLIEIASQLGCPAPYAAVLTMLDCKDMGLTVLKENRGVEFGKFKDDRLSLPAIIITGNQQIAEHCEAVFKFMWNAAGTANSPYEWHENRRKLKPTSKKG